MAVSSIASSPSPTTPRVTQTEKASEDRRHDAAVDRQRESQAREATTSRNSAGGNSRVHKVDIYV